MDNPVHFFKRERMTSKDLWDTNVLHVTMKQRSKVKHTKSLTVKLTPSHEQIQMLWEKAKLVNNSATHLSFVFGIGLSHQRSMVDKAKLRCVPFSLQRSEKRLLSTQQLNC